MEWIVRALKPGGKAFVVVPDGIMNRSNDKRLRDFILDECVIDAVISLPLNTFFTTNKKTYIIALTKKFPTLSGGVITKEKQVTPVFLYLCSEIGETRDIYRFDIEQNDLDVAAASYNMFKGARGRYATDNKRCKIMSIDEFYNGSHWLIERWWTTEEKILLGINDENSIISVNQIVSLITDIEAAMDVYQEPLLEIEYKKCPNREMKTVSLLDEDLFSLITRGIGYNRISLQKIDTQNADDIPVYTAAKEPVAYIKKIDSKEPISASENSPLLSFATNGDGSAGRNFVIHTQPFYINVDRTAIAINEPRISLHYLHYQLSDMKERYGFNHSHKANRHNLASVVVEIPVDEMGCFDLLAQNLTAEQFNLLNDMKSEVFDKLNALITQKVEL
jgi:hypothetical protein